MKLQKNRKGSDHIPNTVYSKTKLLQPSGIINENIKSHVIKTISLQ